jgi:uncharacterized protein (DUF1501 family)
MLRRDLLKYTAAAGGLSLLNIGHAAWAARLPSGGTQRLIVVFLRGAVDGLNVVVPYAEKDYYSMRPTIAIARPGQNDGALDLDGHFGLHPALAPVLPLWKERSLAFIHASGSPDETRSHFDGQAYMENGTPGDRITSDGWLNRLLQQLPGPQSPTEAVNFGTTMPRILRGKAPVATFPAGKGAGGRHTPPESPDMDAVFDRLYSGGDTLAVAYRQGRSARQQFSADLEKDMTEAAGGAPSAAGFPGDAAKLCKFMKNDPSIRIAFFGLSGWDTHIKQGGSQGQLANHLRSLAEGLAHFRQGLGAAYADTVILVVSEFGRTAHENGDGGTDHGHGNVMWILGGPTNGGKVYGQWPGIAEEHLHEERDLAVTTDFRVPIGQILTRHMKLVSEKLGRVFPGMPSISGEPMTLLRA